MRSWATTSGRLKSAASVMLTRVEQPLCSVSGARSSSTFICIALSRKGVWSVASGAPVFYHLPGPDDDEVASLVEAVADKVVTMLREKSYLSEQGTEVDLPPEIDREFADSQQWQAVVTASSFMRVAFGPHAGRSAPHRSRFRLYGGDPACQGPPVLLHQRLVGRDTESPGTPPVRTRRAQLRQQAQDESFAGLDQNRLWTTLGVGRGWVLRNWLNPSQVYDRR